MQTFMIYRTQPAGVDGPVFELEAESAEDALVATIDRLGLEDGWTTASEGPGGSRVTLRHADHRRFFYAYREAPAAELEVGARVWAGAAAGFGVVVQVEPAFLGWSARYVVELEDGEQIWRDRAELEARS